ncbi:hypothetical protein BJV82DRAFT_410853 [Fennellomyces sp. T-0311]|nr:hypothetical protein BJV82DRAFT_410853 [Fennellomyces sp. T-0311]
MIKRGDRSVSCNSLFFVFCSFIFQGGMPQRSFSVPPNTSLALQASIDVPAPTLPVPLMLEMRDALPALEKALAPELSAQCLPLCMQLLSTWVLVSSGSQNEEKQPTRSMTRSRLSRWFTQSFARKKGVAPITDKDISEDLLLDEYYEDDEEDDEITTTPTTQRTPSTTHSSTIASSYQDDKQHALTKRSSISNFLNRLGMSVRKAIVGRQQHEKLALPSPVLEERREWDEDETIWARRDEQPTIEQNTREKTVRPSKTDMDVCREESVPFIKMGLGRRPETPTSVDVEDAQEYRLSVDLRWQERFHEQQHDKIDMMLRSVSTALYEVISHNHAFGLFDYDESFTGSPLLQPDASDSMQELFMAQPVTTWHDIYEQMAYVFDCGELTSEHAIITYIYVIRMLDKSEQSLCDVNWRLVLLAGMLLAVKVWDDCAVYNMDFVQIFPELDIKIMYVLLVFLSC